MSEIARKQDTCSQAHPARANRMRTLLRGFIKYADGTRSASCTVVQLSRSGARISGIRGLTIPESFDLAIPQNRVLRRAHMTWRDDDVAGLRLEAALDGEVEESGLKSEHVVRLEAENAWLKAKVLELRNRLDGLTRL